MEMCRTGLSEADAVRKGLAYATKLVTANDHPGYYPNQTKVVIKLLYEKPSLRLLGANIAGEKGAVLRGDIFATAIHAGLTTPELGMRALSTGNGELLGNAAGVLACSSCGLCTNFACEMGLTPSIVMTMLKQELGKAGVRPVPEENITPDPYITLKEVPVSRLVARMHLSDYDTPAPLSDQTLTPSEVRIALRQHVGKPAEPTVKAGDRVQKGQLIGRIPEKSLGAAIHASINGTVSEVGDQYIVIKSE